MACDNVQGHIILRFRQTFAAFFFYLREASAVATANTANIYENT